MRLHKNQTGSAVIILLIILVLAVVGFGGYYVWHTQHNKTAAIVAPKSSTTTKTSTSTEPKPLAKSQTVSLDDNGQSLLTITVPAAWTATVLHKSPAPNTASCSVTATNSLTPLDSGSATPTSMLKSTSPLYIYFDAVKQPDTKSLADYFVQDLFQGDDGNNHTGTYSTVNGNTAYHYVANPRSTDNDSYEDDYYLISHAGYVACFYWRPVETSGQGNLSYANDVESMVNSTKFTN